MGIKPVVGANLNVDLEPLSESDALDTKKMDEMVEARNAARKARNFKEADRLRDELAAMGIELEDKKDGATTWRMKR